jgi:ABC-type lipoprotein export system ATPase subunit
LHDKLLGEEGEAKEAFTMRVKKLTIEKGTLTFIIGRVGSGKSALLNVILNEMTMVEDS